MDALYLLQNVLGSSTVSSGGEHLFYCPFCYHKKPKLSVNLGRRFGMWKCWVCHESGRKLTSLLYKVSAPPDIVSDMRKIYEERGDGPVHQADPDIDQSVQRLPPEFVPFTRATKHDYEARYAGEFLLKRGLSKIDVHRHGMGYCPSGPYGGRIIIPSYDSDGNLNYFTARSYDGTEPKYKNPPFSKNCIIFENTISWYLPLVIVEGVFDAIAIRRNAVPIMGTFLYPKLESAIIKNKPPKVYVMLDPDARSSALKIQQKLTSYGIESLIVEMGEEDPSELGFEKSWDLLEQGKPVTFHDVLTEKLEAI